MRKVLIWFVIAFYLCLVLVPSFWVIVSSFKTNAELFSKPFGLPDSWALRNYATILSQEPMLLFLVNSVIVSLVSTVLAIAMTMLASYVFLYEFPFKSWFFTFIAFGLFLPLSAFMLPYFLIVSRLGLYNTVWGIVLVYTGVSIPLSFLIIHIYMKESVHREVVEAASIEGASFHQVFLWIVAPICKRGMMTAAIFLLITAWNELLYALLLSQSETSRTVQVAIRFSIATYAANYPQAFGAMMIAILPMILIYISLNKYIVAGLGLSMGIK